MARDPRKQQQKQMKKRQKDKARKQRVVSASQTLVPMKLIKSARQFPILECLVNRDWEDEASEGLTRVLVARQSPEAGIIFGTYLVDMLLLGVKDSAYFVMRLNTYRNEFLPQFYFDATPREIAPALAHQIIYQGIDYAARYGFKPHKDFKVSQHILEPRGTLPETANVTFGKDGRPIFVAGPHDNIPRIIAKLNETAGPGNYDYFHPLFDTSFEDDDIEWHEDEDDET